MKTIQTKLLMLLILVISVTTAMGQTSRATQFNDLIGVKGANAEHSFTQKGYYHINTHRVSNNIYSYWWNNSRKKCVFYSLSDGRINKVTNTIPSDCNKSTYDNGDHGYSNRYRTRVHHYPNQTHYSEGTSNQAFDRGFQDGLHHKTYHNFYDAKLKGIYATGYTAGTSQRTHNTSYHSGHGGYTQYTQAHDVNGKGFEDAYRILKRRGFSENSKSMKNGKEYILWYNRRGNQCIRTIRSYNHIISVDKSHYCNR